MSDLIEVVTTCGCQETAQELARNLVNERLAACVQITGPIKSVFRWNNQLSHEQEWLCTIKSTRPLWRDLLRFITEHHPYDVPEILARDVAMSSPSYQDWVRTQVRAPTEP